MGNRSNKFCSTNFLLRLLLWGCFYVDPLRISQVMVMKGRLRVGAPRLPLNLIWKRKETRPQIRPLIASLRLACYASNMDSQFRSESQSQERNLVIVGTSSKRGPMNTHER
ncbi:hypothetical protein LSTR_LSTR000618 [Laodelphax striatellus]|uniref:Uncharacterized protein n=1 Tax=Laodelphax striatellus TaxID=195883 RepID=A0A482XFL2_LAOST|nr:hypothetical protein LSTR_LSTR000618 [Laodelphax striatellus]